MLFPRFLHRSARQLRVAAHRNGSGPAFCRSCSTISSRHETFAEQVDDFLQDSSFEQIKEEMNLKRGNHVRNALVVQPRLKSGADGRTDQYRSFLLDETMNLVKTLPYWFVEGAFNMPCNSFSSRLLFGSGNLEKLSEAVSHNKNINTLVLSMDMLRGSQQQMLEQYLRVQAFDRYSIVLQIFHQHASSGEAKIQIALAEIAYIFARIRMFHAEGAQRNSSHVAAIGGSSLMSLKSRKKVLDDRKRKLMRMLEKLGEQRDQMKHNRLRKEIPSVAVVGYTNSGKTTLIKSITNDERLQPKDAPFATLDVTVHETRLPSFQKVLLTDTVGFVTDIPTALISAFHATLKDIATSDLILHVFDLSNPWVDIQIATVKRTLQQIKVPEKLSATMISLGNKVDLVQDPRLDVEPNALRISAKNLTNIRDVCKTIDETLVANTGRFCKRVRVKTGRSAYRWLMEEANMLSESADEEDSNYTIVNVLFTQSSYKRFISYFCENGK